MARSPKRGKNPRRDIKLRSWKVTLSTKGDIPPSVVDRYYQYVFKNANVLMHYTVIERGETGRKHLHGLICLDKGQDQDYLQNYLWRHIVKPFVDDTHIGKIAARVDINSDDRWINEYLKKEAGVEIITSEYDIAKESEFYPTADEQARLQVLVGASNALDSYYAEHAGWFAEWLRTHPGYRYADAAAVATTALCIEYFKYRMFNLRDMKVIRDRRIRCQIASALALYITRSSDLDFEERKWCAAEHGPTFDFRG